MKTRGVSKTINLIALGALLAAPITQSFGTTPHSNRALAQGERPSASLLAVLGDFDGDRRIDRAELHLAGAHRSIRVRYGDSSESYLDLRETSLPQGALLARDINGDRLTDLIWIFSEPSELGRVWFGDGAGHFSKHDDVNVESLRAELSGRSNVEQPDNPDGPQIGLTTDPISCEPARSVHLASEARGNPDTWCGDRPRYSRPHLSNLRERGPPPGSGH